MYQNIEGLKFGKIAVSEKRLPVKMLQLQECTSGCEYA